MDSFSVTLTKLKGRRLSRKSSGSYFGLERVLVRSVVRAGDLNPTPFLALARQTKDGKKLTLERRHGVKKAPRFCLGFSSRFRLLTLPH
jgi:hypothetical protein